MRLSRDGFSIDAAISKGRTLPDWYIDEPELLPGDDFYLKAFDELSSTRAIGMGGIGPIPWNQIIDYAADAGLDDSMIVAFRGIIRAMDTAYITWSAEMSKTKTQK